MIGKFITTTDKVVAEKLKDKGLQMVLAMKNVYTFINEGNMNFSDDEDIDKKIFYSDKLFI